jgi:hypothetical protein
MSWRWRLGVVSGRFSVVGGPGRPTRHVGVVVCTYRVVLMVGLARHFRPSGSLLVRTSTRRVQRTITSFLISTLREGGRMASIP